MTINPIRSFYFEKEQIFNIQVIFDGRLISDKIYPQDNL